MAPAEEEGAHGRGLADTDGCHGGRDVGHCVVDGETRGDGAARGVYVEGDGARGGVGFEEEELCDDGGGGGVVDGAVEADDALAEEAREDVV